MIVCWLAIRGWQTPFQVIFAKIPLKPDNHPNYLIFHPKFLKTKKIGCLTTTDFQKTNYLKTNLLKQIKKISFRSLRFISFGMQSYRLIFIKQKKYLIFLLSYVKKTKKRMGARPIPIILICRVCIFTSYHPFLVLRPSALLVSPQACQR